MKSISSRRGTGAASAASNAYRKKIRERLQQLLGLAHVLLEHGRDGVEGVEEEMRVDPGLERRQLRARRVLPQPSLDQPDLAHLAQRVLQPQPHLLVAEHDPADDEGEDAVDGDHRDRESQLAEHEQRIGAEHGEAAENRTGQQREDEQREPEQARAPPQPREQPHRADHRGEPDHVGEQHGDHEDRALDAPALEDAHGEADGEAGETADRDPESELAPDAPGRSGPAHRTLARTRVTSSWASTGPLQCRRASSTSLESPPG